jgi:hypothetical protein
MMERGTSGMTDYRRKCAADLVVGNEGARKMVGRRVVVVSVVSRLTATGLTKEHR